MSLRIEERRMRMVVGRMSGMRRRKGRQIAELLTAIVLCAAQFHTAQAQEKPASAIDRDLMEISVDGLHRLYAQHRYTVTQVTQWYLDRIARYDGTYRALLFVDTKGALARAAEEDASAAS